MTLLQAIQRLDALKFNTYTNTDKVQWLSELDNKVKIQIMDTHEGPKIGFYGYDPNEDMDTELLVPAPFDEMYLRWMEAQIDYHNGEYDRFNASITMFNSAFDEYANYYNRKHIPVSRGTRFVF